MRHIKLAIKQVTSYLIIRTGLLVVSIIYLYMCMLIADSCSLVYCLIITKLCQSLRLNPLAIDYVVKLT